MRYNRTASLNIPDGHRKFSELRRRFKGKDKSAYIEFTNLVKKRYNIQMDFEFGYDKYADPLIGLKRCEKFERMRI